MSAEPWSILATQSNLGKPIDRIGYSLECADGVKDVGMPKVSENSSIEINSAMDVEFFFE